MATRLSYQIHVYSPSYKLHCTKWVRSKKQAREAAKTAIAEALASGQYHLECELLSRESAKAEPEYVKHWEYIVPNLPEVGDWSVCFVWTPTGRCSDCERVIKKFPTKHAAWKFWNDLQVRDMEVGHRTKLLASYIDLNGNWVWGE